MNTAFAAADAAEGTENVEGMRGIARRYGDMCMGQVRWESAGSVAVIRV